MGFANFLPLFICITKNTDTTVGIAIEYNLIIPVLNATSCVSVFNKHGGDLHRERCDRGLNPTSDKYSVGATQAESNEGNYVFVLSLECFVLTWMERFVTGQSCHRQHEAETLESEIYMAECNLSL